MSVTRSQLGRGPAHVSWNGITMFTRDDIMARHVPIWKPVTTSMYGAVDKERGDLVIKIPLRLWGAWESLPVLFPAAVMNPNVGSSLFGDVDLPLVLLAKNGDKITYANAQITKISDLHLGLDAELFASDVEFTALVKNGTEPEAAGAYYTTAVGQAYAENVFSKANFKKVRWTGAWGAKAGFTAIVAQKGFNIGWDLQLSPVVAEGATRDMTIGGLVGNCKCIPIGPTIAQVEASMLSAGAAPGSLLSAGAADLTLTGAGGGSVVLKNAGPIEHGYAFGVEPLRLGEIGWETTRAFAAGVPAAVGVIA